MNYLNLGSHLDQLVTSVEEGQATSLDAAGYTPVHSGASVAVTIYLSDSVDGVVAFLEIWPESGLSRRAFIIGVNKSSEG